MNTCTDNLTDALEDLTALIDENPHIDRFSLAENVAHEYDLNPLLLARKFSERHGTALLDYTPPPPVDHAAIKAAQREAALITVRREAAMYQMTPQAAALVGRPFTFKGQEYLFICYRARHPKWAISAVRTTDGQLMKFTAATWQTVGPQITSTSR